MKKFTLYMLFGAMPFLAPCQSTIDGFGKIRLGSSYENIVQSLELKKIEVVTNGAKSFAMHDARTVVFRFDSTKDYSVNDLGVEACSRTSILNIPKYEIAGIEIRNMKLQFWDDVLYSISIQSPSTEFLDAIKAKYGDGATTKDEKIVKCSSAFAKDFSVKEQTFTTTWSKDKDPVRVFSLIEDYRDANCKQQYLSIFEIIDLRQASECLACVTQTKEDMKTSQKNALKKKLADF